MGKRDRIKKDKRKTDDSSSSRQGLPPATASPTPSLEKALASPTPAQRALPSAAASPTPSPHALASPTPAQRALPSAAASPTPALRQGTTVGRLKVQQWGRELSKRLKDFHPYLQMWQLAYKSGEAGKLVRKELLAINKKMKLKSKMRKRGARKDDRLAVEQKRKFDGRIFLKKKLTWVNLIQKVKITSDNCKSLLMEVVQTMTDAMKLRHVHVGSIFHFKIVLIMRSIYRFEVPIYIDNATVSEEERKKMKIKARKLRINLVPDVDRGTGESSSGQS